MGAIWHESDTPSFLAPKPAFSFFEQAIVVEVAPITWQDARKAFEATQQRLGIGPEQHQAIAKRAAEVWAKKRPLELHLHLICAHAAQGLQFAAAEGESPATRSTA